MAFIETPRFPDDTAYWAQGGPEYNTDVVEAVSGIESRTAKWPIGRCRYTFPAVDFTPSQIAGAAAFFRGARGKFTGFRFKDFIDYQVAAAASAFVVPGSIDTTGCNGMPTSQLAKLYTTGGQTDTRPIRKPVAGTVVVSNTGTPLVAGTDYTLDTTTGILTWPALASATVSAVTVGATTVVTLSGALAGLAAGGRLYLTGLTGADAALVNAASWPVASVAGAVYTLSVNTAGKTITPAGSGKLYMGGRAADALTWSGQFDVPVRFDTDRLSGGWGTGGLWTWNQLALLEVLR